ncbi:MAG TPA: TetR/AcrR family transcriptional regulator [Cyclobacteriaceae bacterium]|nr:TetR/AcrR family transcriptional regulator [Cyclobacteriaceae bacterium]
MHEEGVHTEKLIKETAKRVFFQKGRLKATTQEIADEAGVNRALIHYYFRSREQMLDMLLDEVIREKKAKMVSILSAPLPFKEKIAQYISYLVDRGISYPYLENFIISEIARSPEKREIICARDSVKSSDLIKKELHEEIERGGIAPITPEHFMVNLSSLCNYPLLAKSIFQTVHGMTDASYKKFLLDRKQVIFRTIFNEDLPLSLAKKTA